MSVAHEVPIPVTIFDPFVTITIPVVYSLILYGPVVVVVLVVLVVLDVELVELVVLVVLVVEVVVELVVLVVVVAFVSIWSQTSFNLESISLRARVHQY